MNDEIQLISDGDGLAVIGDAAVVDRFLAAERLPSRDLELPRLVSVLGAGAGAAEAASTIAATSGRWVKLTEESAQAVKKYGLRESSKSGLSTGVIKGKKGQVKGFVEFAKQPGSLVSNPAVLAGAAGIMAQVAMQQTMGEITDYLAAIEEKVDDVLRAQKDGVLARMIGVGLVVEEAMAIRERRGRVDEVTWSKVQAAPATVAETQAYALRQLDALADRAERKGSIGDIARATQLAEAKAQEWLAVLARCFQLQDAIAVLELDRVLDASPGELDAHRQGLRDARQDRLALMTRATERLMLCMTSATEAANAKVLTHPAKAPAVVAHGNHVGLAVAQFHEGLGVDQREWASEARRWGAAATELRDSAVGRGADGVHAVRRVGTGALTRAKATGARASERVRRQRNDETPDGESNG